MAASRSRYRQWFSANHPTLLPEHCKRNVTRRIDTEAGCATVAAVARRSNLLGTKIVLHGGAHYTSAMDDKTAAILGELIESQSALLRMVLTIGFGVPNDPLHQVMKPLAEQVTVHLETAVRLLNDAS